MAYLSKPADGIGHTDAHKGPAICTIHLLARGVAGVLLLVGLYQQQAGTYAIIAYGVLVLCCTNTYLLSIGLLASAAAIIGVYVPSLLTSAYADYAFLAVAILAMARGFFFDFDTLHPMLRRLFVKYNAFIVFCVLWSGAILLLMSLFNAFPLPRVLSIGSIYLLLGWGLTRAGENASRPVRTLGSNIGLGIYLFLAVFLCLELFARLLFEPAPPDKHAYAPHPRYGVMLRPNTTGSHLLQAEPDQPPEHVPYTINARGFRGPNLTDKKTENEFRILMLGDSFVMSDGVTDENTLPRFLEKELNHALAGHTVRVINAGTGGTGPWQQLGVLLERGLDLDPDLLIHQALMGNDIADTLLKEDKVLFAHNQKQVSTWFRLKQHNRWHMRLNRWIWSHARIYQQFQKMTRLPYFISWLAIQSRFAEPADQVNFPPPPPDRPWYIENLRKEWTPLMREGWKLMKKDILEIRQTCRKHGIDFLAYAQPMNFSASRKRWDNFRNTWTALKGEYDIEKDYKPIHDFYEANDIPFIDLTAALRSHPEPASLYFKVDGHHNATGNAYLARVIAEYLLAEYFPTNAPWVLKHNSTG